MSCKKDYKRIDFLFARLKSIKNNFSFILTKSKFRPLLNFCSTFESVSLKSFAKMLAILNLSTLMLSSPTVMYFVILSVVAEQHQLSFSPYPTTTSLLLASLSSVLKPLHNWQSWREALCFQIVHLSKLHEGIFHVCHTHSLGLLAATRSEKIAVHFDPQWMEASFSGCWQLNQPASHWWVSDYFQSTSQYMSAVIECQHPCPVFSWPNVMAVLFCLINVWNSTDTFQQEIFFSFYCFPLPRLVQFLFMQLLWRFKIK